MYIKDNKSSETCILGVTEIGKEREDKIRHIVYTCIQISLSLSLSIYIYIYMCVHIYICIYIYVCMYTGANVYTNMYIYYVFEFWYLLESSINSHWISLQIILNEIL